MFLLLKWQLSSIAFLSGDEIASRPIQDITLYLTGVQKKA